MPTHKIARIAFGETWRRIARAPGRTILSVAVLAMGVTALGAARGSSNVFDRLLTRNLGAWIASDVCLITGERVSPEQEKLLTRLRAEGLVETRLEDTIVNATTDERPDPAIAFLRIVDPRMYPMRGEVKVKPPAALDATLRKGVAASRIALATLNLRLGDTVYLNGLALPVAAELEMLPDQLTLPPSFFPMFVASEEQMRVIGLSPRIEASSQRNLDYLRILYRLPAGAEAELVRLRLMTAFPGRKVLTSRHPDEQATAILRMARAAVEAFGWIALLVALLGVQVTLWSQVETKLDTASALKCLGARAWQVIAWVSIEAMMVLFVGSAIGAALAARLEYAIVQQVSSFLGYTDSLPFDWIGPFEAAAIAPLSGLLLLIPYFDVLRRTKPSRVLRRAVQEGSASFHSAPLLAGVCGVAAIAALSSGKFAFAVIVGAALLFGAVRVEYSILRRVAKYLRRIPLSFRYAIANLLRPGNYAELALFALTGAVTLGAGVWTVRHSMAREIAESIPQASGLLMVNVPPDRVEPIEDLLTSTYGAIEKPMLSSYFALRVLSVDGRAVESKQAASLGLDRRWLGTRTNEPRRLIPFLAGLEWNPSDSAPEVLMPRMAAEALGARVGSTLEFESAHSRWRARVGELAGAGPLLRMRCCFVFNAATPEQKRAVYHGFAKVPESKVAEAQRALYRMAPTVSTMDLAIPFKGIQAWLGSVLHVLEVLAAIAGAAASILFAGILAITRGWRRREIAIAKTVGATPATIFRIHAMEFGLMGALAGLIGSGIAMIGATAAWNHYLEGHARYPGPGAILLAATISAVVAVAVGWLAIRGHAQKKPMLILWEE